MFLLALTKGPLGSTILCFTLLPVLSALALQKEMMAYRGGFCCNWLASSLSR